MKRKNVIFVGGTGQNVLLGYLHLLNLKKYIDDEEPPEIFIFDADLKPGTGNSVYARISSEFGGEFKLRVLSPYPSYISRELKFTNFLGSNGNVEKVKRGLYENYQLELNIANGFYGEPSIGAPVIASKIREIREKEKGLEENEEEFRRIIKESRESLYVLVGSVFGGTGASGIPSLATLIRDLRGDFGKKSTEIKALIHTKWYKIIRVPGDAPIYDPKLERNAHSGLMYSIDYTDMKTNLDFALLIGLAEEAEYLYEGPDSQSPKVDPVHFLSSIALIWLLYSEEPYDKSGYNNLAYIASKDKFNLLNLAWRNWGPDWFRMTPKAGGNNFKNTIGFLVVVNYLLEIYIQWFIWQIRKEIYKDSIFRENLFPGSLDRVFEELEKTDRIYSFRDELQAQIVKIHNSLQYIQEVYEKSMVEPYNKYFNFNLEIGGSILEKFVPFNTPTPSLEDVVRNVSEYFLDRNILKGSLEKFNREVLGEEFPLTASLEELSKEILKRVFWGIYTRLDEIISVPQYGKPTKSILLKGDKWNAPTRDSEIRLIKSAQELFDNKVLVKNFIYRFGIPNIWSTGIYMDYLITNQEVNGKVSDCIKKIQLTILKGIFSGILVPKRINLDDLGVLGKILVDLYPGNLDSGNILTIEDKENGKIVAIWYPGRLFFPAAEFSSFADKFDEICKKSYVEEELEKRINKFYESDKEIEENFRVFLRKLLRDIEGSTFWKALYNYAIEEIRDVYDREFERNSEKIADIEVLIGEEVKKKSLYVFVPQVLKNLPFDSVSTLQDIKGIFNEKDLAKVGIFWDARRKIFVILMDEPWAGRLLPGFFSRRFVSKNEVKFYTYGDKTLSIIGEIVGLEDILCKRVLWIKKLNGSSFISKKVEEIIPEFPVKSKYLGIIEMSKKIGVDGGDIIKYKIRFNHSEDLVVSVRADITDKYIPWLKLWPKFRPDTGWRLYYLWYTFLGGEDLYLKVITPNDISTLKEGQGLKLESIPTFLALTRNNDGIEEEMGILSLETLQSQMSSNSPSPLSNTIVSIDLGTSNSCAAVKNAESVDIINFKDHSLSIIVPNDEMIRDNYEISFVCPIPTVDFGESVDVLPTEVLRVSSQDDWSAGFSSFAIRNPRKLPIDMEQWDRFKQYLYKEGQVVTEIKWSGDERKLKIYLYLFLTLVYSELFSMGIRDIERLIITYPLTFDTEHLLSLIKSYKEVTEILQKETGIRIKNISLINESVSATDYLPYARKDENLGKLVLDLGGGSLDFCFLTERNGEKNILLQESVKIGGEDIIESVVGKGNIFEVVDVSYKIRRGYSIRAIFKNYHKSQEKLYWTKATIFEYLRRLLNGVYSNTFNQKIDPNGKIKGIVDRMEIHLLGNGWKLKLEEDVETIAKNIFDMDVNFITHVNPKESIAKGAINSVNVSQEQVVSESDFGRLINLIERKDRESHLKNIKSFVGIDVINVKTHEGIKNIEWYFNIPCNMEGGSINISDITLSDEFKKILNALNIRFQSREDFIRLLNRDLVPIINGDVINVGGNYKLVRSPWTRFVQSFVMRKVKET